MEKLYGRSVFFVADAERAMRYYTEHLGFSLDWDSKDGVFQVSLFGFELIINQVGDNTRARVGHGRVFIGLENEQGEPVRKHIAARRIETDRVQWGRPTLVLRDLDANELYFWMPHDDFTALGPSANELEEHRERESDPDLSWVVRGVSP